LATESEQSQELGFFGGADRKPQKIRAVPLKKEVIEKR